MRPGAFHKSNGIEDAATTEVCTKKSHVIARVTSYASLSYLISVAIIDRGEGGIGNSLSRDRYCVPMTDAVIVTIVSYAFAFSVGFGMTSNSDHYEKNAKCIALLNKGPSYQAEALAAGGCTCKLLRST